jgi:hypothetical protein
MTCIINGSLLPKSYKFNVLEGKIEIVVCIGQFSIRFSSSDHAVLA